MNKKLTKFEMVDVFEYNIRLDITNGPGGHFVAIADFEADTFWHFKPESARILGRALLELAEAAEEMNK